LQVVLDTAMGQYLAGEITLEEFERQVYDGWEAITQEVGREKQREAYGGSLGATR
jgi:multiple sugar transport system substrate-binding protein